MKYKRTYVALLLVAVFAFNIWGYCFFTVLILSHKSYTFHNIVSGNIGKKEICTLTSIQIEDANWEDNEEFEWRGEMYDVIKRERILQDIVYTCKKDIQENQLKKLKRQTTEKSAAKKMVEMNKIFVQAQSLWGFEPVVQSAMFDFQNMVDNYNYSYTFIFYSPPRV